jgi:hypothetical protein
MTRRVWACLLFAGVLLLASGAGARAQPFVQPVPLQPPGQQVFAAGGTDIFRAVLAREGFKPIKRNELTVFFDGRIQTDSSMVVIVLGSGQMDNFDPHRAARDTVLKNGAALLATDAATNLYASRNEGQRVGFVSGADVTAAEQDAFDRRANCPFAVPLSPEEFRPRVENPGPVFGLFRGLRQVATNGPSDLRFNVNLPSGEYVYPLARFPRSARVGFAAPAAQPPLLAVGGDGAPNNPGDPAFAFVALSDPSVFINQMMLEAGTDNFAFAERVAKYLKGPEGRARCLFVENGRVIEDFDSLRDALTPKAPPPDPNKMPNVGKLLGKNQDKLVKLIDDKLDDIQRKDLVHKFGMGAPGTPKERSRFGQLITVLLVFLSARLLLIMLSRTTVAKHPTDVPHPPTTGAGAASTGPTGVFDRRRRELMRRNNVFDPVSHLMREFFLSVGAPPDAGPRIPRVWVTDSVRRPDSLRQAVRDMWRIAFGPPMPLTAQRWFEIEPYFDRLRQAHADGKWKFVLPE